MKGRQCSRPERRAAPSSLWLALLLAAALLVPALTARAGSPEWLKAAAREPLPPHPDDADAVQLLDEQVTTVSESGEIKTRYRRAYKILRPGGRDYGTVAVYFDNETRLTYLKAWCLPAEGKEYEVKEGDAVETSPFSGSLYEDTRAKVLEIPAADPGNVVGYEYEQKDRPFVLQNLWVFQEEIPMRRARFVLELPRGWEFDATWMNHVRQEPQTAGENRWLWEVENIPAVEPEPAMPPWRAVAGHMVVRLFPPNPALREKSHRNWEDMGRWQWRLAEGRDQASPPIRQKVAELTAGAVTPLDKMRTLAAFVQRDIRYVAIEVGIGGYQPHLAQEIFSNRYGDCKDKATLLSAMLREVGVESYYVSIHNDRGMVGPETPASLLFNHRILAIRLPEDVTGENLYALVQHPRLGRLLFFDPTDSITPLGQLPYYLQANYGLIWGGDSGELVKLPLLEPSVNRLERTARFTLSPAGALTGQVEELRGGVFASARRASLLDTPVPERRKVLENFLAGSLPGFSLQTVDVENLEEYDENLVLRYRFTAPSYAKSAGDLLLLRPRVLGQKGDDLLERQKKGKQRLYPVEFDSAELHSDVFEIELPAGYAVDEVPPPVELDTGFIAYKSRIEVNGNLLRYQREYTVKSVEVPLDRLAELKKFYRQVAADERASVVLKRKAP